MSDILDLQQQDPAETPEHEKKSSVSVWKVCNKSYISVSFCFVR